ncbi:MAG: Gfo/Idh/MocA family oxidoreductase [Lentisphaeria bacterium]|nr:Gfo/Idh/MocA family oxidoreductase [Lentisphaeria bacterium]
MTKTSMKIGVIGCGMISDWYFKAAKRFKQMNIVACGDLRAESAEKQGKEYNIPVRSVEEIYTDPEIEMILNLTPQQAHYAVSKRALECGKHVYSEKPLCGTLEEAEELLKLAESKNLQIAAAPDTFLGGGPQTVRKLVDEGWIGKVFAGTAMFTSRGPETWPHAAAFYKKGAGPMLDYAPYFITQLVNVLGPAVAVTASVTKGTEFRVGGPETVPHIFPVEVPTFQSGIIEFASGAQITVIASYDVWRGTHPYIELYGTKGSINMHNPNFFGGTIKVFRPGYEGWQEVPSAFDYNTDARSIGAADLIESILTGRKGRVSSKLSMHVLEIMLSFEKSSAEGKKIFLKSTCEQPEPMVQVSEDGLFE